jgi:hypothetical protein
LPHASAEERYVTIVKALARRPGVSHESPGRGGKGFGSSGQLKVNNRIFAMLVRDELVVKLPKDRVDGLIKARHGRRFDPRRDGRLMKEWLVLPNSSSADWMDLTKEALKFVRGNE